MATDKDKYYDFDDLGLYLTLIESSTVTFNSERTIEFKIIRPFDPSEKVLRYNYCTLIFKNVFYCDLRLLNEFYEYPEFYRSAILEDSSLLRDMVDKLKMLNKQIPKNIKHYYLYIDQGNAETEVHIICEGHDLIIDNNPKLLTEFYGLDE